MQKQVGASHLFLSNQTMEVDTSPFLDSFPLKCFIDFNCNLTECAFDSNVFSEIGKSWSLWRI